jgi:ATP-dependent protease ClpP protease subunit
MAQFKYRNDKNAEAISRIWGKSLDKPDWYSIAAQAEDETEIIIYDVIGWPFVDADAFVRDLANIKTNKITVRINSPGGDIDDGLAIFNSLSAHKAKVTTRIEGIAASISSVIALAGDEVQAYKNTMYMIHDPWVLVVGNQYLLRDIADVLEKYGKNMIDIYADNGNVGKRDLKQMMQDETWFTAKEAQERGFIDTVLDAGGAEGLAKGRNQFDLSMFAKAPEELQSSGDQDKKKIDKRTLEHALRDAGLSQVNAKAVIARGFAAISEEEALAQTRAAAERVIRIITS